MKFVTNVPLSLITFQIIKILSAIYHGLGLSEMINGGIQGDLVCEDDTISNTRHCLVVVGRGGESMHGMMICVKMQEHRFNDTQLGPYCVSKKVKFAIYLILLGFSKDGLWMALTYSLCFGICRTFP